MKPVRPTRKEQEQNYGSASSPSRAEQVAPGAETSPRRPARAAGSNPGAGWRLPSGQLLVEYALQTCFTGSPFQRPAFPIGGQDAAGPVHGEEQHDLSQQLHSLQNAVGKANAPSRRSRRTPATAGKGSRTAAGKVKERVRS